MTGRSLNTAVCQTHPTPKNYQVSSGDNHMETTRVREDPTFTVLGPKNTGPHSTKAAVEMRTFYPCHGGDTPLHKDVCEHRSQAVLSSGIPVSVCWDYCNKVL
jgi:hypothetical protein